MAPVLKKVLARNKYWLLKANLTKEDLILVRSSKGLDKTSDALGDVPPHKNTPRRCTLILEEGQKNLWRFVKPIGL
jgi:hypothetical protein